MGTAPVMATDAWGAIIMHRSFAALIRINFRSRKLNSSARIGFSPPRGTDIVLFGHGRKGAF